MPGPFAEDFGNFARLRGIAPEQHDAPVEIVLRQRDFREFARRQFVGWNAVRARKASFREFVGRPAVKENRRLVGLEDPRDPTQLDFGRAA